LDETEPWAQLPHGSAGVARRHFSGRWRCDMTVRNAGAAIDRPKSLCKPAGRMDLSGAIQLHRNAI